MMKCDLDGLLGNAAMDCDALDSQCDHGAGYGYALRELATNLRELRNRTEAGDMTALDEFFSIYVFATPPEQAK